MDQQRMSLIKTHAFIKCGWESIRSKHNNLLSSSVFGLSISHNHICHACLLWKGRYILGYLWTNANIELCKYFPGKSCNKADIVQQTISIINITFKQYRSISYYTFHVFIVISICLIWMTSFLYIPITMQNTFCAIICLWKNGMTLSTSAMSQLPVWLTLTILFSDLLTFTCYFTTLYHPVLWYVKQVHINMSSKFKPNLAWRYIVLNCIDTNIPIMTYPYIYM